MNDPFNKYQPQNTNPQHSKWFILFSNVFWYKFSDCTTDTDSSMNMLMPMLMMNDNSTTDSLMMMMMMQSMGSNPVGMDMMMPFLMMDESEDDSLLTMLLMNSMTGGMNSQVKIENKLGKLISNSQNGAKVF